MDNIIGKFAAASGAVCLMLALWVNSDQTWKWFWSGIILLFVSLFTTATYRLKREDKTNHG